MLFSNYLDKVESGLLGGCIKKASGVQNLLGNDAKYFGNVELAPFGKDANCEGKMDFRLLGRCLRRVSVLRHLLSQRH